MNTRGLKNWERNIHISVSFIAFCVIFVTWINTFSSSKNQQCEICDYFLLQLLIKGIDWFTHICSERPRDFRGASSIKRSPITPGFKIWLLLCTSEKVNVWNCSQYMVEPTYLPHQPQLFCAQRPKLILKTIIIFIVV